MCTKIVHFFLVNIFINGGDMMNDENQIQQNITTKTDTKSIYYHINNLKKSKIENDEESEKQKQSLYSTNKYIAIIFLSVLIYVLCAWSAKVTIPEIIDLEVPVLVLISLILTAISNQKYAKGIYILFIIIAIIIYQVNTTYSLFISIALLSNWIYYCIENIYSNKEDYNNNTGSLEITFKIKDFFNRMKFHILLSFIIFMFFTIITYYYPGIFQSLIMPAVDGLKDGVKDGTIKLETIPLFMNNLSVALNMILGGFYLSVTSMYLLVYNALIVGYTAASMKLSYFLSLTLPHGVLELSAIILAGAAGTRITQGLLKILSGIRPDKENKSEYFSKNVEIALKMIFDSALLIILITIMLFIAAFIEANLTLPIGQMLMGI